MIWHSRLEYPGSPGRLLNKSFLLQPFAIPLEVCSAVLTKINVKGDFAIGAFQEQQLNVCPGKT